MKKMSGQMKHDEERRKSLQVNAPTRGITRFWGQGRLSPLEKHRVEMTKKKCFKKITNNKQYLANNLPTDLVETLNC